MRHVILTLITLLLLLSYTATAQPKREFRGAWIQCVNGQFQNLGTEKMQQTLTQQLNELKKMGCNAVIFQVRAECDALYQSYFEPWSRFLTGQQGVAPNPMWDPLEWMVDQCHMRGMELHAWINPYRAKVKGTSALSPWHVVMKHPERCFEYDGQLLLNPALQENRDYICIIASDIVSRYDIDGLHIDDYFYPYPVDGKQIPDYADWQLAPGKFSSQADWRRNNVNLFIEQLYKTVHALKPWVKVGVSPFGIYRNKSTSSEGSNTNGLQNYDDLYADVLYWIDKGWLDYCAPQIYWEIGNKAADYDTLIRWWDEYAGGRPLFIGEDVERTVKYVDPTNPNSNQQPAKQRLHRQMKNVDGMVLWYAKAAIDNPSNFAVALQRMYWNKPSLQPEMSFITRKSPDKPKKLKVQWFDDQYRLTWKAPSGRKWHAQPTGFVVYRFEAKEKPDFEDVSKIVAITNQTSVQLPYFNGETEYQYYVTALNRIHNESEHAKRKVKL